MTEPLHPDATPAPRGRLRLQWFLVLLLAAVLALPLVQQLTGTPPDVHLAGSEIRPQRPVFTWADWFDGSYATRYEKWLQANAGFRGLLVHLASQANWSIFGRLSSGGTEVSRGKGHWLFETAYIKAAVRQPDFSRAKAARFAEQAAELEAKLAARGIAFAVIVSPSKAEVLPEYLPRGVKPGPRSPATAYARISAELEKRNVTRLNVRRLFLGLKRSEPFLFPKTGTHWSAYGAWVAWQAAAAELEAKNPGLGLVSPAPERLLMAPPQGADDDLLRLLNLWVFDPDGPQKLPYPVIPAPPPGERERYQAVLVGDSFSLTLADAMARSGRFRQLDLLYYFNRRFTYPAPSFTPAPDRLIADPGINMGSLDPAHMNWENLLDNRQLVLLVINEYHLKDMGWGMMESLLNAL